MNMAASTAKETDKERARVEKKRKVIAFDLHYKNKLGCHNFVNKLRHYVLLFA